MDLSGELMVKQVRCITVQKMSSFLILLLLSSEDTGRPLLTDMFLVFLQILGLVFSMTMFCQAVKVDTFYA